MMLLRLPVSADNPAPIPLPYAGAIFPPFEDAGGLSADPRRPGAVFSLESWVRAVTWFSYDPGTGRLSDTGATQPFPRDTSGYDTIETVARTPDVTEVPLTIVAKHGIKLDGSHPTLVRAARGGVRGLAGLPALAGRRGRLSARAVEAGHATRAARTRLTGAAI